MAWTVIVARPAAKQLMFVPRRDHMRIIHALSSMETDPYTGDVQWIRQRPGVLRRRVGVWRIFFEVDREATEVRVIAIVRRRTGTY